MIKNERAIKALNWFNTKGSWITIQLFLTIQLISITTLVCWAAFKYVPEMWDWGVVITQGIAFLTGVSVLPNKIHQYASWWHHKGPTIFIWFSAYSTGEWHFREDPWMNTYRMFKMVGTSLKYNAFTLAAVGVIYAVVEFMDNLKPVKWNNDTGYIFVGIVGLALAMFILHIINRKIREFIRFCREMRAINRLIKESCPHEDVIRDQVVGEWMRKSSQLSQIEGRFLADWQGSLDTKVHSAGLAILATSFKVKPAGEYATRASILEAAEELEKIGRGLIHNQQVADAHLFRVRKRHEDSKKTAKPAEAVAN